MASPADLRYSKSHEWVRIEGDVGVVGITDHAQEELGDITFVELPSAGDRFDVEEVFGSVESVKAVSDLIAPVSGEILEVNQALATATEVVNQDPYGAGWMARIRLAEPADLEALMDAAGYDAFLAGAAE